MSARKGIKQFGERAVVAILKEFAQLDEMGVVEPLNPDDLTTQQRRDAPRTVSLLKEKHSGELKGRTCADGSKQQPYVTNEDSSSPTVSTEALMTTFVIDAYERRVVATANVTGAYLNVKMDQLLIMKIEGDMV